MGKGMLRGWQGLGVGRGGGRVDRNDRGGEGETAMGRGTMGRGQWGGGNGEEETGGGKRWEWGGRGREGDWEGQRGGGEEGAKGEGISQMDVMECLGGYRL